MRIAVFGAGYAGLTLARRLERRLSRDAELVVVDRNEYHLVQHELHRVVRRPSLGGELAIPLDEVLDRATLRRARVTDIDPEAKVATLDDGTLDYDVGAVCLGTETAFYDLPGLEEHATPLKSLADAEAIREGFLEAVRAARADRQGSTGGRSTGEVRVVVGGAGLSGIQVAGELAALARERSAGDAVELVLLEQLDAVAPGFPADFQEAVRDELEDRGVVVRTETPVTGATDETVDVEGESLAYDLFVWTGGIRGPSALDGERPAVRSTLLLGDGTFVPGDTGRIVDAEGRAVPASAQAAVAEARVAATNVLRLVDPETDGEGLFEPRLEPFTFDSPGWLVSVGDGAVAQVGGTVFRGAAAKALKASVGAGYLTRIGAIRNAVDLVSEELAAPRGRPR